MGVGVDEPAGGKIECHRVVEHAPPKQEIARMIGASREMVSRVVKDLQRKGLIRAEKRKIFVLDKQSMQRRASTRHHSPREPQT